MLKIFSYASVETLKNCRLVNRLWYEVITTIISTKTKSIRVSVGSDLSIQKLRQLTSLCFKSKWFPCSEFSIETSTPPTLTKDFLNRFTAFFASISPFVLNIKMCIASRRNIPLGQLIENLTFPRLQTLQISFSSKSYITQHELDFVNGLVWRSPDLYALALSDFKHPWDVENILISMHESGMLQRIKHLTMRGHIRNRHLNQLLDSRLQLKYVELCFDEGSLVDPGDLKLWLESQRDSLKELHIKSKIPLVLELPRLATLNKLTFVSSMNNQTKC